MNKVIKKKKNSRVNLSVKVHPSAPKAKRKSNYKQITEDSLNSEKKVKIKKKKSIFKKERSKKTGGFLKNDKKKKKKYFKKTIKREKKESKKEVVPDLDQDYFIEYNYGEEKSKVFLMKSGVTFFMILIFFMWAYNTKRSIANSIPKNNNSIVNSDSWQKISNNFNKIKEVKNKIELNNNLNLEKERYSSSSLEKVLEKLATTSPDKVSTSSEQIEKLKEEINKILK